MRGLVNENQMLIGDRRGSCSYLPVRLQKRNKYMVDNSDCVLCCYNGATEGGTYNTVRYAEKSGKRLLFIDLGENAANGKRDKLEFVSEITDKAKK